MRALLIALFFAAAFSLTSIVSAALPQSQIQALTSAYNLWNQPQCFNWNLTSDPCGSWTGVVCNSANNSVVRIDLFASACGFPNGTHNFLTLPASFANLTDLTVLDLTGFSYGPSGGSWSGSLPGDECCSLSSIGCIQILRCPLPPI